MHTDKLASRSTGILRHPSILSSPQSLHHADSLLLISRAEILSLPHRISDGARHGGSNSDQISRLTLCLRASSERFSSDGGLGRVDGDSVPVTGVADLLGTSGDGLGLSGRIAGNRGGDSLQLTGVTFLLGASCDGSGGPGGVGAVVLARAGGDGRGGSDRGVAGEGGDPGLSRAGDFSGDGDDLAGLADGGLGAGRERGGGVGDAIGGRGGDVRRNGARACACDAAGARSRA